MKVSPSLYTWKPNRKFANPPSGIIIHAMSEYIHHDAIDWITGYNKMDYPEWIPASQWLHIAGLSVHSFIHPNGIIELGQSTDKIAYHAGKSKHNNLVGLNNYYLGFEILMEGKNLYNDFLEKMKTPWVTDEQFMAVFELCKQWMGDYHISVDNIVTHYQVSGRDVRPDDPKYDPGIGFKYNTLISLLGG